MNYSEDNIVSNIIKIRQNQGLTKRGVADMLHIGEASYGRIEARKVALTYKTLADIASCFNMEVLDILTYPYHFVLDSKEDREPAEVMLQIKLKKEKREKVMRLIFGDNNIEILDK